MNRTVKHLLIWVATVGFLLVGWRFVVTNMTPGRDISISAMEMQDAADGGKIASLTVVCGTDVTGIYKDGSTFHTTVPPAYMDSAEVKELNEKGVKLSFSNGNGNQWLNIFFQFLPIIVLLGLFLLIMRRYQRKAPEAGAA